MIQCDAHERAPADASQVKTIFAWRRIESRPRADLMECVRAAGPDVLKVLFGAGNGKYTCTCAVAHFTAPSRRLVRPQLLRDRSHKPIHGNLEDFAE